MKERRISHSFSPTTNTAKGEEMALDPLPDDLTSHKVVQLKVNLSLLPLFSSNLPHQQLTPSSSLSQELLKERSLPVSGTKAQLISRLQENDLKQEDRERENGDDLQQDTETNDKGEKRRTSEEGAVEREGKRIKSDQDDEMGNRDEEEATSTSRAIQEEVEEKERPVNETISAAGGKEGETRNEGNRSTNGHEAITALNQEVVVEEGTSERQEVGEEIANVQDEAEEAANTGEEEEDDLDYSFPTSNEEEQDSSSRPTDMYLDTVSLTISLLNLTFPEVILVCVRG